MADQKISELTALTGANLADVDAFAVVDTSAVQTKKITYAELKTALDTGTGFVRITGDAMTGALGITQTGSVSTVPLSVHSNLNSGQAILELRSTGSSNATIDLRADGTGDPRILFDLNGATPFSIGVDNSDGDKFKISGTHQLGTNTRLTIDSSGNSTFGGNISSTGNTLSMLPTAAGAASVLLQRSGASNPWYLAQGHTSTNDLEILEAGTSRFRMQAGGAATFGGSVTAGGDITQTAGDYHYNGGGNFDINNNTASANTVIRTTPSGGSVTEIVRFTHDGKVGILDSVPQDYLEINGSNKGLGGLTISNSSADHAALSFARSSTATARIKITEPASLHTSTLNFQTSNASGGSPNLITAMTIDENQKVGIGTTSPSESLEVNGNIFINTSGNPSATIKTSGAGNNPKLRLQADTNYWDLEGIFSSATDDLFFGYNGSTKVAFTNAGNVGIGETQPLGKLHVKSGDSGASSVNANANELVVENSDYTGITILGENETNIYFGDNEDPDVGRIEYHHSDNSMRFRTNASDKMHITSSGNVGIGTNSPNSVADLHVADTSDARIWLEATSGDTMELYAGTNVSLFNRSNNALTFGTNNAERMRIDNGGSVLIGTTTPTDLHNTWTHVMLGDKGSLISQNGAGGIGGTFITDNVYIDSDTGSYAYVTTDQASLLQQEGGEFIFKQAASGSAGAGISFSEAMRIDNSGNVGIGWTAPAAPLDVRTSHTVTDVTSANTNSTIVIGNTGAGNGIYNAIKFAGNQQDMYIMSFNNGTVANRRLGFFLGSNAGDAVADERLSIIGDGNVGIGTTSPSRKLDVKGSVNFSVNTTSHETFVFTTQAANDAKLLMQNASSATAVQISANGDTYFNGGNVGIGTSSPSFEGGTGTGLEIRNSSGNGAHVKLTDNPSGAGGTNGFDLYAFNTSGYIENYEAGSIVFRNNGSEAMRIDNSQRVGIGTSAPVTQLDVVSSGNSEMLIHADTDTVGSLAHLMFKTDSQNLDSRMKGAIIFKRDDPGTRGTGSLHLCVNGVNSDVNAGIADSKLSIDNLGRVHLGAYSFETGQLNLIGAGGTSNKAVTFSHTLGGGVVGSITTAASSTAYNTSSDYRLKENVDYTWDATTRLKQLKPARFNFIADETNTLVDGFLAHEVSSVVPEAITGTKDAVDGNGNPEYQGIDQAKLVPLLVKTIQELEARITALEA